MAPGQGGTRNTPWTPGPAFPPSRPFAPFYTYLRAVRLFFFPTILHPPHSPPRSSSIVCPMTGELVLGKNREREDSRSPSVSLVIHARNCSRKFRDFVYGERSDFSPPRVLGARVNTVPFRRCRETSRNLLRTCARTSYMIILSVIFCSKHTSIFRAATAFAYLNSP